MYKTTIQVLKGKNVDALNNAWKPDGKKYHFIKDYNYIQTKINTSVSMTSILSYKCRIIELN